MSAFQHPDTGDLKAGDHVVLRRRRGMGVEAVWGRLHYLGSGGEVSVHCSRDQKYYGWKAGDEIEKDVR